MEEKNSRINKDEYYLEIAFAISKRSPCLRRRVGAILVKNDVILATGYNGPPRKTVNCDEIGCLKDLANAPHGEAWDLCPAVHAEENCITNAARQGTSVLGATLYISGEYLVNSPIEPAQVCDRCKRILINAGIKDVVIRRKNGSIEKIDIRNWVEEEKEKYVKKFEELKEKRKENQ